jgi:hypothetical protein
MMIWLAGPTLRGQSLPGLTRQSIALVRLVIKMMDARVKPAHDERILFDD